MADRYYGWADGAFLCGPRAPTEGDLAAVAEFKRFLECMTCTQRQKCALNGCAAQQLKATPNCFDDRGCPDPGGCSPLLVCPMRERVRDQ